MSGTTRNSFLAGLVCLLLALVTACGGGGNDAGGVANDAPENAADDFKAPMENDFVVPPDPPGNGPNGPLDPKFDRAAWEKAKAKADGQVIEWTVSFIEKNSTKLLREVVYPKDQIPEGWREFSADGRLVRGKVPLSKVDLDAIRMAKVTYKSGTGIVECTLKNGWFPVFPTTDGGTFPGIVVVWNEAKKEFSLKGITSE